MGESRREVDVDKKKETLLLSNSILKLMLEESFSKVAFKELLPFVYTVQLLSLMVLHCWAGK